MIPRIRAESFCHVRLLRSSPLIHKSVILSEVEGSLSFSSPYRPKEFPPSLIGNFNIRNAPQFEEKLRYIHRNPVTRGLWERPEDWSGAVPRGTPNLAGAKATASSPSRVAPSGDKIQNHMREFPSERRLYN